ncbi:MAG: hypothetical protein ABIT71_22555, partial [Vicinamibacteraceae bacterium]
MSTPPTWPPPPPPPPLRPPLLPPGVAASPPPGGAAPPKAFSLTPVVVLVIVAICAAPFVLGFAAAIVIPGFLRARMTANETAALGTMQTMTSAQTAWSKGHDGRYASAACLGAPASCGDAQSASLVTPDLASLRPSRGYEFGMVLRPGADGVHPTATGEAGRTGKASDEPTDADVRAQLEQFSTPDTGATPTPASPRAGPSDTPPDRGGFVFWASPASPGSSGSRRFCVDETGLVRQYR